MTARQLCLVPQVLVLCDRADCRFAGDHVQPVTAPGSAEGAHGRVFFLCDHAVPQLRWHGQTGRRCRSYQQWRRPTVSADELDKFRRG